MIRIDSNLNPSCHRAHWHVVLGPTTFRPIYMQASTQFHFYVAFYCALRAFFSILLRLLLAVMHWLDVFWVDDGLTHAATTITIATAAAYQILVVPHVSSDSVWPIDLITITCRIIFSLLWVSYRPASQRINGALSHKWEIKGGRSKRLHGSWLRHCRPSGSRLHKQGNINEPRLAGQCRASSLAARFDCAEILIDTWIEWMCFEHLPSVYFR